MAWDYAALSKLAKKKGGPEKLVDFLITSGKAKMYPWLWIAGIVGVLGTLAVQKVYKYITGKKAISDVEVALAKQELIQGIKDYDAKILNEQNATENE